MNKESFRQLSLGKLSNLSNEELLSLSFSLTNQLIKFLNIYPELSGQIGSAYLPFKKEIAPAYQELLRNVPLNLSYPFLKDSEMRFAIPQGMPKGSTWLEGPYVEVDPEWFLIPGLAFDYQGGRLGRGKGFYDRYLEERDGVRIGLAWSELVFEKTPVESHDCHMDFIITEKFCWDVSTQKRF